MKANNLLQKALERAVSQTIESIAFEESLILPGPVEISGEVVAVSLRVVSPYLLTTMMLMPKELADKLIRVIYRDDEKEITDELLYDTVGEFLNTIIGTMMGELTHGERIFEMGLPERVKEEKEFEPEGAQVLFFQIEELPFCVAIEGEAFVEEK
ncbi:MAG: chemotaxis protein CheX [Proteobacteria bacterium]|nr:chemotaxis protein CheX [Pseudomonadota bacterium]